MALLDRAYVQHRLDLCGLTQAELAKLAGVSEPTLSRALNGYPVSRGTIQRLAGALRQLKPGRGVQLVLAARS
jgi:transcriptional regulator with XRE-family HTH domain